VTLHVEESHCHPLQRVFGYLTLFLVRILHHVAIVNMASEQANGKGAATVEDKADFYDDEVNLKKLCNFLRSTDGPAVREAIEMDKRVYYLKGEKLVNFLAEPKKGVKWPKDLPRFESRQSAITVCKTLCEYQFIHRSEKRGKGDLVISRVRDFDEAAIFTGFMRETSHLAIL
jgi:hypothetical protein